MGSMPVKADESSCDLRPSYVQINTNFIWQGGQQNRFANAFSSGCPSATYFNYLTNQISQAFAEDGISLSQITIFDQSAGDVISVSVATDQDVAGGDFSVLLPLRPVSTGQIITSLEIVSVVKDAVTEGDELVARYTVNETKYQSSGGRLALQWLRDGVPIAGASKSRYQLQRADVGATISANLMYLDGNQGSDDSRLATVASSVLAANYPPEIKDLKITGLPETNETLTAIYEFVDDNEGDLEQGSKFIWLRDNIVIAGADQPTYQIGAEDIGKQLGVRVVPRTQDGQLGQPRTATLPQAIRAKKIETDDVAIETIVQTDSDKVLDAKALEDKIAAAAQSADEKNKERETVQLAKPLPRPAPDDVAKDDLEKDDAPALIITPKDDISDDEVEEPKEKEEDIVVSEVSLPPTILTPGFEITSTSPTNFTGLDFTPTAILLEFELKRIEKSVTGAEITLEAIKTVLDEVNALYLEKGFELSRALLPEQIVTDGKVTIQLVEATVGKIHLENIENLKDEFVRDHLAAVEGDFISLRDLETSIRIYNLSNKSKLATELAPGAEFGETDIFVDVAEPDKVELPSVSVNNYANQTSDWRQNAISVTWNNLLGIDDETAVSYTDGDGSTSQSFSYSMPVDNKGTNISVALSGSDTKINSGSEETVGYRGSSSSFVATYSTPIQFGDEYSLYASATYGVSKSDLVQPVTGALLTKSEVRKYSFAMPYSYNNGTTAFSVAPAWSTLNVVTKIPEKEKWVQKLDIDANASHYLNEKWTLNGRAKALYTDAVDMINMPSEILSVGGPASVRAYQPAESSGYQGYFVSGELRTDLANWEQVSLPDFMPSAQAYVFVDHMMAQSTYKVRSRADYWSGYGIGLQIPSIFNLLTFDIYWSEPLDGDIHEEEKEFYDDELFQFSLSARFRLQ
ncbi:MAG: POTRA domain-containing protein [Candidatus Puniceispirillaceae bacterium]